jgi:phage-related minor tail protein
MDETQRRLRADILSFIYGQKNAEHIVSMLRGGPPAQALAMTATMVVKMLMTQNKYEMTPELSKFMMSIVIPELAEFAEGAGVKMDEQAMRGAMEIIAKGVAGMIAKDMKGQQMPGAQPQGPIPSRQGVISNAMGRA